MDFSLRIVAGIAFTYLFCPLACGLAISAVFSRGSSRISPLIAVLAMSGIGPLAAGWILDAAFRLAPGNPDIFYVSCVVLPFVAVFAVGCRGLPVLAGETRGIIGSLGYSRLRSSVPGILIMLLSCLFLACCLILVVAAPANGNDALEYGTLARIFVRDHDNAMYLFRIADHSTGFFTTSSHPLGYTHAIAWHYIFQGFSSEFGSAKIISPFYHVCIAILTAVFLRRSGVPVYSAGFALAAFMPGFTTLSLQNHLDLMQVYFFLLSVFWVSEFIECRHPGVDVLTGFCAGLAMSCHSIGIMTPFFCCACIVLSRSGGFASRFRSAITVLATALLVGGSQYMENWLFNGRIIGDYVPLWEMDKLGYTEWLRVSRGLDSLKGRILNGVLQCWSKPYLFGVAPWLALMFFPFRRRLNSGASRIQWIAMLVLVLFYCGVAMSVGAGTDLVIKNFRYSMVIQPFFILPGAMVLGLLAGMISSGDYICIADPVRGYGQKDAPVMGRGILVSLFLAAFLVVVNRSLPLAIKARHVIAGDKGGAMSSDAILRRLMDYVAVETPGDSLFLVFRMGEFAYYANRKFVSHLDPSIMPLFTAERKEDGFDFLRKRGITHVFIPAYDDPAISRTVVSDIIEDPSLVNTVVNLEGWRIYALRD